MSEFPAIHSAPEDHIALVRALLQGNRSAIELRDIVARKYALAARLLSDDDVLVIRQRFADGERQSALAVEYDVAESVISHMLHGRTYRSAAA